MRVLRPLTRAVIASTAALALACHGGSSAPLPPPPSPSGAPAPPAGSDPTPAPEVLPAVPVSGTLLGAGTPAESGGSCAERLERLPAPQPGLGRGPVPCGGGFCFESGMSSPLVDQLSAAGPDDVWGLDDTGRTLLRRIADGTWTTRCLPPGARALHAVHAAARNDVWVAGADGFIAHWDGAAWTRTAAPTSASVVSIAGDARHAFAASMDGTLLTFDGNAWEDTHRGPNVRAWSWRVAARGGAAIAIADELLVWSGTEWAKVAHDGWSPTAIWVSPRGVAWVGGARPAFSAFTAAVLFRVHGQTAQPVALPGSTPPLVVASVGWIDGAADETWVELARLDGAGSDILRVGDDGRWHVALPRATTAGAPHVVLGTGDALLSFDRFGMDGFGGGTRVPGGRASLFRWTADLDAAAAPPPVDLDVRMPWLQGVAASSADDVWFAGNDRSGDGVLWHRTTQGWTQLVPGGGGLLALATSGPSNTWAAGTDEAGAAFALRWDGAQLTRVALTAAPRADSMELATASPSAVWVSRWDTIERWDGAGWTTVASGLGQVTRLWATGEREVWALTTTLVDIDGRSHRLGRVLRITDGGVSSRELLDYRPAAVWASSPRDVWVSAVREAGCSDGWCFSPPPGQLLLRWDGASWTRSEERGFASLSGTGPSDVWGVASWTPGGPVTLQRYDGRRWTVVATLEYPFLPSRLVALPGGELWGLASGGLLHRRRER